MSHVFFSTTLVAHAAVMMNCTVFPSLGYTVFARIVFARRNWSLVFELSTYSKFINLICLFKKLDIYFVLNINIILYVYIILYNIY